MVWDVRWVASTASTNADVAAAARTGAAEGHAVVADHQSAGRGRLGRRWEAPPGAALAASFLLRPDGVPAARWPWLPLLVGVACAEAIAKAAGVDAVLKWPNDVLLTDGRKLAGILVERVDTPPGAAAVVGVGLNVSQRPDQLPPGAASLATAGAAGFGTAVDSAYRADGAGDGSGAASASRVGLVEESPRVGVVEERSRIDLVGELGVRLTEWYTSWRAGGGDPAAGLAAAYVDRCDTLGRDVRVELPGGRELLGRAVDVDDSGRLVVHGEAGPVAVSAGDVVHVRRAEPPPLPLPPHG